jgi:hypothetical protein
LTTLAGRFHLHSKFITRVSELEHNLVDLNRK